MSAWVEGLWEGKKVGVFPSCFFFILFYLPASNLNWRKTIWNYNKQCFQTFRAHPNIWAEDTATFLMVGIWSCREHCVCRILTTLLILQAKKCPPSPRHSYLDVMEGAEHTKPGTTACKGPGWPGSLLALWALGSRKPQEIQVLPYCP